MAKKRAVVTSKVNNSNRLAPYIPYIIIALVFAASFSYVFDGKLDLNGDNATYYLLGNALKDGAGYTNTWGINPRPHNHYPVGYPALIAVFALFSNKIFFIKIVTGLFFLAGLLLLYKLFIKILEDANQALLVTLILAVNSHLLRYSTIMMSEIPFLFYTIAAIYLVTKIDIKNSRNPLTDLKSYGLIILLSMAYYTRSLGLTIIFGITVYFILHKNWKYTVHTLFGVFVLVLPWYLRKKSLGGNSYIKQLIQLNPYRPEQGLASVSDLFTRFLSNLERYISVEIPSLVFPQLSYNGRPEVLLGWAVGLALLAIMIYGLFRLKHIKLLVLSYVIATFGITLLWPEVWTGARFILHLTPFFTLLLLVGIIDLITRLSPTLLASKRVFLLLIPFLILAWAPIKQQNKMSKLGYPVNWANYLKTAQWMAKNTPRDATVVCRKGSMFYIFSGRRTDRYNYSKDDKVVIKRMHDEGADYVVIDQLGFSSTPRYLVPAINKNRHLFQQVLHLKNPDTYLLKIKKDAAQQ